MTGPADEGFEMTTRSSIDLRATVWQLENMTGVSTRLELLRLQLAYSFAVVRERIEGISDDEFFWEPVADCWSVRPVGDATSAQTAEAKASRCGWFAEHGFDGATFNVPEPPPFTTIAWKLQHMASCNVMYHEHAFGDRRDLWGDLVPHTARGAIELWQEGHQLLVDELDRMTEDTLDSTVLTEWGAEWPAWRIFWVNTHHDLQHGSEIACIRDLYAHRHTLSHS